MVKIIGPCFGLDARGTLGKSLTYSMRRGTNYIRSYVKPVNPMTYGQLQNRAAFQDGVSKWRFDVISANHKEWWTSYALGTPESKKNFGLQEKEVLAGLRRVRKGDHSAL